jgi:putative selenium metabolism hydrolase
MKHLITQDVKQELIEFTQEIIRIPSYTGAEEEAAKLILRKLREFGVKNSFIDGIGNVVGILRGKGLGPNIMLNSHMDVVPEGSIDNWKGFNPFGGEIDQQGNIHGRGSADLKGGLSVHLFTMKLLSNLIDGGIMLPGDLIFSSVVHEEAAEMFGMEYLCRKTLPEKQTNLDVVFLCEPTDLDIKLGHRGKVEIVVTTRGKTAHSSTPSAGINALEKMLPILDIIFNKMPLTLPTDPEFGDDCITVTNLICKPGTWSIIPDECQISIDRRYGPGETLESILNDFRLIFNELKLHDSEFDADVSVRTFHEKSYTGYEKQVQKHLPIWATDKNHPFVIKTVNALGKVGQQPKVGYWKFGTDGSMTGGLLGIPTIGYAGTEIRYCHTPEEIVNIDKMVQSLEGYFSIVCELDGIDINSLY